MPFGVQYCVVVADGDDRIEEAADLFDDAHQPLDVRVRRIALVRRRLDAIDGQRDEQQRRAAERVAVARQNGAAVRFDVAHQPGRPRIVGEPGVAGLEAHRLRRGFAPGV